MAAGFSDAIIKLWDQEKDESQWSALTERYMTEDGSSFFILPPLLILFQVVLNYIVLISVTVILLN